MKTTYQPLTHFTPVKLLSFFMFLFLFYGTIFNVSAQSKDRRWGAGFAGGTSVYAGDLGNGITDFNLEIFRQNLLGSIQISRYLNASLDIMATGTYGTWGYYDGGRQIFKGKMTHANLTLKYKFNNNYFISAESKIAPYIFAGAGFSNFSGPNIRNGSDFPAIAGAGLNFKMSDVLSINYQATFGYMFVAYNNPNVAPYTAATGTDQFMFHTLGFNFNLGMGKDEDKDGVTDAKDKCAHTPERVKVDASGCPLDSDGDGVLDYQDNCKDIAGTTSTKGCPDLDKDGVADNEDQCPNEPGIIALKGCPDTDGDGVIDSKDDCPNVKGKVELAGCPDSDGDGVIDSKDKCPEVNGSAAFAGCPDTDGDGIEDSQDMCPNEKGPMSTKGCPDTDNDGVNNGIDKCPEVAGDPTHSGCPDTDKDGIFDDIDRCITIPGAASNQGCPEIKKETKQLFQRALQGIQFENGKAVIKPASFAILNAIVKVMIENPTYKLIIGGHTDNVGDDAMNMTLSNDRAASVSNYLIKHGVDPLRVSSQGFGESSPVDTNETAKGRTRNRRVEFKVEFLETVK